MWSKEVKRRDGNKCVLCGTTEGLQAHHIKPVILYPEYKNDLDNGITLCRACHLKTHGANWTGIGSINGLDPDPENRIEAHGIEVGEARNRRTAERKGLCVRWGCSYNNAPIIVQAAKAAGQTPYEYIGEAVAKRLEAEGFPSFKG